MNPDFSLSDRMKNWGTLTMWEGEQSRWGELWVLGPQNPHLTSPVK
jgi:hypothetical protein